MKENGRLWALSICALLQVFACEGSKGGTGDNVPPLSIINSPQDGAVLRGAAFNISGTATDGTGSGVVLVEVSTDGGNTWTQATLSGDSGQKSFDYVWDLPLSGTFAIKSRAKDKAGNQESPGIGITVRVDNDPPDVTSVSPSDGSAGVSISVTIAAYFSEPLDPSTVTAGSFALVE